MRGLSLVCAVLLCANDAPAQEAELAVLPTQVKKDAVALFPALFDEFLLTAVQNKIREPVIGKDDIDAVLGFEKTKELMGCDDVACMADIGGALGVAKLVHAQVDKLDKGKGSWVVTTKLIDTSGPTVQSRTSDFVDGDAQALLKAIPEIVGALIRGVSDTPAPARTTRAPTSGPAPLVQPRDEPRVERRVYDDSYGSGARIGGVLMTLAGLAAAVGGAAYAIIETAPLEGGEGETILKTGIGVGIAGAGLVLFGIGQSTYLNGRARAHAVDNSAKGYHSSTWLGWLLAGVAVVVPMIDAAVGLEPLGKFAGVGGMLGAMGIWTYTMVSDQAYYRNPTTGARRPMAKMFMLRDRYQNPVPAYGFAIDF